MIELNIMKTLSKTSKGYLKNTLNTKELNEASEMFFNHKGSFLDIKTVLKIENQKKQVSI